LTNSSQLKIEALDKFFTRRNITVTISHSNYLQETVGGVEKLIKVEDTFCQNSNLHYVQIFPIQNYGYHEGKIKWNQLLGLNIDSTFIGFFSVKQLSLFFERLRKTEQINVLALLIHHMMGFFLKAIHILEESLQPQQSYLYIHDFYTICPQFNLLKNDTEYCGAQLLDSPLCQDCSYYDARSRIGSEMQAFIYRFQGRFIFPAEITKHIWLSVYNGLEKKCQVVPHQNVVMKLRNAVDIPNSTLKIGYIGNQQLIKGYLQWKEVITQYKETYALYHLGTCQEQLAGVSYVPVSVLKQGDAKMVEAIQEHKIDIAFLWSICPETYSFTFFESLAAGCFILSNNTSGNIAAMIKHFNCGKSFNRFPELLEYLSDVNQVQKDVELYKGNKYEYTLVNNHSILEDLIENNMQNAGYLNNSHSNSACCDWSDSKLLEWKFANETEHVDQVISLLATIYDLKNRLQNMGH